MIPPLAHALSDGVVTLREWTIGDASALKRVFDDPEMVRWTDAVEDEPLEEFEATIRRGWERRHAGERLCLAIVDQSDAVLGAIDLMLGEFERGELGYALGASARGAGAATRAVRLAGDWAFAHAGIHRLELPIPIGNHRSRAVAERAGYQCEGVLRSYLWLREGGERQDVAMYSRVLSDAAPS
jgi:ribosomal-protein-alanine N-acetyltransferase